MLLIVGLGNPGMKYDRTRHNVGFMVIDRFANKHNITIDNAKWKALVGEGRIAGEKVLLMKPQTYMNLSGHAVRQAIQFYKLDPEEVLVICDDIDIAFGHIRLKSKGSAGTHNGLKSIVQEIGSSDFPRLKIAVGRKPAFMDLADFVLSKFSRDEEKTLDEEIETGVRVLDLVAEGRLTEAMNLYNGWSAPSLSKKGEEKNGE